MKRFQLQREGLFIAIFVAAVLYLPFEVSAQTTNPNDAADRTETGIDWSAFLQRNDMVWSSLPNRWDNAPFIGNGNLGTIFWQNAEGVLRFEMSRSDLYDHRRNEGSYKVLFSQCRLPNGNFQLSFGTEKPIGDMRLDLWNAEVRGNLTVGEAKWAFRTYAHAKTNVVIIEVDAVDPSAKAPLLTWHPDISKTTRTIRKNSGANDSSDKIMAYPPQEQRVIDEINVSVQSMPEDVRYRTDGRGVGEYATAWTVVARGEGHFVYYLSTEISYPGATAAKQAVANVQQAKLADPQRLLGSHREWWHAYYPKSFLSVPDGALESYYWIQMYKMGSASRRGGPIIDLMGPWYRSTSWPAAWWNLNIQLTYWPFYIANHLEEAEPLHEVIWANRTMLAQNAAPYEADSYAIGRASGPTLEQPVGNEVGNLPWTMHNLWLYYRSSMDDAFLRERLFPLMKGTFNYVRHITTVQPDGKIVILNTSSPEYTGKVDNSSYTMACFRWLAGAIIKADERLKSNDPVAAECRNVLAKLAPYEIDPATGIMVGKNVPFDRTHRHWSHLFMIYPFQEWNWNDPARRPLMEKSLANWTSKTEGFAGYSWLGAASMYSAAGQGDRALKFLHTFLQKHSLPNTLYREGSPVIETPLQSARTVQELLMMTAGDVIRVFPGVSAQWKDVSFDNLRAEGAFLVSAVRKDGVTQFVTIKSLAGEPLRICTGLADPVVAQGSRRFTVVKRPGGESEVDLAKDETVTFYSGSGIAPKTVIAPVSRIGEFTPWGREKSIKDTAPRGFR